MIGKNCQHAYGPLLASPNQAAVTALQECPARPQGNVAECPTTHRCHNIRNTANATAQRGWRIPGRHAQQSIGRNHGLRPKLPAPVVVPCSTQLSTTLPLILPSPQGTPTPR